jgi:hypothetical protein
MVSTTLMYAADMSIVTISSFAERCAPSSSKKLFSVSAFLPGAAHTILPVRWLVTTVMYW